MGRVDPSVTFICHGYAYPPNLVINILKRPYQPFSGPFQTMRTCQIFLDDLQ